MRYIRIIPAVLMFFIGAAAAIGGEHNLLLRFAGLAALYASTLLVFWARRNPRSERSGLKALLNPVEIPPVSRLTKIVMLLAITLCLVAGDIIVYHSNIPHDYAIYLFIAVAFVSILLAAILAYAIQRRH